MQARCFSIAFLFVLLLGPVEGRVFTDDAGRTVEAELVGVRGNNVVLARGKFAGRWPIAKLSAEDQTYVKKWQENPPVASRITARIWERDGISSAGTMATDEAPAITKNIPLLKQTTETDKYKYYEVDLFNESNNDAGGVTMAYVLYVISPQGSVIPQSDSIPVESIQSRKRQTVPTKSVTYTRTKTTTTTFKIDRFRGLSTGSKTSRSSERFGGAWVRVYEKDGSIVGEARKLKPEVARLKPAWTGPSGSSKTKAPEQPASPFADLPPLGELPVPASFELLEKILSGLAENLPPKPGKGTGDGKKPGPPPKPKLPKPTKPKPPGFPPGPGR